MTRIVVNKIYAKPEPKETNTKGCTVQLGIMSLVSAVVSYALNKSVLWAIFHGFFWFIYLFYVVVVRAKEIVPAFRSLFGV